MAQRHVGIAKPHLVDRRVCQAIAAHARIPKRKDAARVGAREGLETVRARRREADRVASDVGEIGRVEMFLLGQRGDTLATRVITRYDSLPKSYTFKGSDSTIVRVDSAYLMVPRPAADSAVSFTANDRIEVYDVTDAANDTAETAPWCPW